MELRKLANEEETCLSAMLMSVGVMPAKTGYRYLKRAVMIYHEHDDNMQEICTAIAKEYGVTKDAVERDMRTAIDGAYKRGSLVKFNEIAGIDFVDDAYRFRTKEFIALVKEFLSDPRCRRVFIKGLKD